MLTSSGGLVPNASSAHEKVDRTKLEPNIGFSSVRMQEIGFDESNRELLVQKKVPNRVNDDSPLPARRRMSRPYSSTSSAALMS
jgi:hypothetical protein